LEIVIAHSKEFDWNPDKEDLPSEERLRDQVDELRKGRLAEKKRTRQATPTPLLGLSVAAECEATGLVAMQRTDWLEPEPHRLVSREIVAKLEVTQKDKPTGEIRNKAKERLLNYLRKSGANFNADEFEFSDELDHLGRTGGEESYIAVVHIDGNGMGEVIEEYVGKAKTNREYIERMRDFSESVERASRAALVKTLITLRRHIAPGPDPRTRRAVQYVMEAIPASLRDDKLTTAQRKQIQLFHDEKEKRPGAKPCWPFRPLVFGGDDVTFVCNGQLGLSLATVYMNAFTAETRNRIKDFEGQEIHTGAGVCIVKVHYPFRRAYDLSERLTKSAKNYLKTDKRKASAMDWHISSTGLSGTLKAIRDREYAIYLPESKDREEMSMLLMRPVRMRHATEWRTWENFNHFVATLNYDNRWAEHRNKIKSLREALRGGVASVKEFLALNKLTGAEEQQNKTGETLLPAVLNDQGGRLHETGWESGRCVYFDAIEAMDHHFLLGEVADAG
jgi:hypothetical protein